MLNATQAPMRPVTRPSTYPNKKRITSQLTFNGCLPDALLHFTTTFVEGVFSEGQLTRAGWGITLSLPDHIE